MLNRDQPDPPRRLPNWKPAYGWAAGVPPGVQASAERLVELTLIPHGCTNIRVTEFPCGKE
jgi:hypothetical protein